MYTIVGLGNPGRKYFKTRHNIGFRVIDFLINNYPVISHLKKKTYLRWEIELNSSKIYLIKPRLFMNESGIPVKNVLRDSCITPEEIIVVYDDIHIPFEKIRIRKKGSSGGHNGINSIIKELQTNNFPRIKIGIGNENIQNLVDYVLSNFTEKEETHIPAICETVSETIADIIKEGIEKTMAKHNG